MSPESHAATVAGSAGPSETSTPQVFQDAVSSMSSAPLRGGISLTDVRAPQRLAPYSYALGLEVDRSSTGADTAVPGVTGDGVTFGRLTLLHDPAGDEGPGLLRLVAFIQADMDSATLEDPLLPEVAWEWLTDGLDGHLTDSGSASSTTNTPDSEVGYRDLSGTVSSTTSVRHGDIGGPPLAHQLELRASWSATGTDLSGHVTAFSEVLASVAGLPPTGVAVLPSWGGH